MIINNFQETFFGDINTYFSFQDMGRLLRKIKLFFREKNIADKVFSSTEPGEEEWIMYSRLSMTKKKYI